MKQSKNQIAWEKLFDKYDIVERVNKDGYFQIESRQINEFRESRLMAKFDQEVNLPPIFKDNKLSILPIAHLRDYSRYVIGNFDAYSNVTYNSEEPETVSFPRNIESIDYTNLYSETAALQCAHVSEMIDNIVGEKTYYTVAGKMSTGVFDFDINNFVSGGIPTVWDRKKTAPLILAWSCSNKIPREQFF